MLDKKSFTSSVRTYFRYIRQTVTTAQSLFVSRLSITDDIAEQPILNGIVSASNIVAVILLDINGHEFCEPYIIHLK